MTLSSHSPRPQAPADLPSAGGQAATGSLRRASRLGFVRVQFLRDCGLALGATGIAIAAGLQLGDPAPLAASTPVDTAGDSDNDGVGNLAELVWGMNPLSADTDQDGYGDLDELALGTDPTAFDATIDTSQPRVGMLTAADNGFIVARVAFYVPDGDLSVIAPTVGLVFKNPVQVGPTSYVTFEIPSDFYLGNGTLTVLPAINDPNDHVAFFDVPVPQAWAGAIGWLPIYASVGPPGGAAVAAAANNVVFRESIPYVLTEPPAAVFDESSASSGSGNSGGSVPSTGGSGGGVVYLPLLPPDALPPTSSKGEICFQDLAPVGVVNGVVQYEVITSDCFIADSYCSASCPAEEGGAVELFDPLGLIGG